MAKKRCIEVNVEELDQIIDHGISVLLSKSDS